MLLALVCLGLCAGRSYARRDPRWKTMLNKFGLPKR